MYSAYTINGNPEADFQVHLMALSNTIHQLNQCHRESIIKVPGDDKKYGALAWDVICQINDIAVD